MALTADVPIPYGIRDIKLTAYTDLSATTLTAASTAADLTYGRTLSFTDSEDFDDFRGDDKLVTSHGHGSQVNWSLESGGIPFDALAIINGGTTTTAGTGATLVVTYTKLVSQVRPWFQIEGQSINDNGGDTHCVIPKCKMTGDLTGDFADQAFFATASSGVGYPSTVTANVDQLYYFKHSATVTPIVITP